MFSVEISFLTQICADVNNSGGFTQKRIRVTTNPEADDFFSAPDYSTNQF